jgi:hypothetical protein
MPYQWTAVRRWAPFVACLSVGCSGHTIESAAPSPAAIVATASTSAASDDDGAGATPIFALDEAEAAALDPRMTRLRRRALPLLVTELQQLETLLHVSQGVRDAPLIVRRLAEDYVELAAVADAEADAAQVRGDAATVRGRRTVARRARRSAISNYRALIEAPEAYPRLDEVEWYLALECGRAGDAAGARREGLRLITEHPDSNHVARAYFLFGAAFASEASGDPSKHTLAEQAFAKAATAQDPTLRRVALLRLEREARAAGDTTAADDASRRLASPDAAPDASSTTGVTAAPPARPPAPAPGCTMDVQCKGNRLCRDGRCVDP